MKTTKTSSVTTTTTWEFTEDEIKAMIERRVRGLFSADLDGELIVEFDECSRGGIKGATVTRITTLEVVDMGPLK